MKIEPEHQSTFPLPLTAEKEKYYLEKMQQGNKQAKEKLILHNMRLVVHIAKKYFVKNENEDLISIGYFGLVKGLESFQLDKDIKLSTYLGRCIDNEIKMYLRKVKTRQNYVSIESSTYKFKNGNELTLNDILKDENSETLLNLINEILDKDQLENLLRCLSELEVKIITMRYGLCDGIEHTQNEIAQLLGVSRSYISHLEKIAINKMKDELKFNEKFRENNNNF